MARLIIDGVTYELPDGSLIAGPGRRAGVPFDCNTGICGSCLVTVLEGEQNLGDLTQEEKDLGLGGKKRLACRCTIKGGTVKITF